MHPALRKGPLFLQKKHPHFPLFYIKHPHFHFFTKKHFPMLFPAYGLLYVHGRLRNRKNSIQNVFVFEVNAFLTLFIKK